MSLCVPTGPPPNKSGLSPGERGWSQNAEERVGAEGWVKDWKEGMRERDGLVVDEGGVADASSSTGQAGGSSSGKSVLGKHDCSLLRRLFYLNPPLDMVISSSHCPHRQHTLATNAQDFCVRP